jgi:hypothetical protein
LQGGAPVGMTSSSHPKIPCSPKNKSPNLQGKHEQKKKSLVRKRNPTARRGHLHPRRPLYSHCLAWSMRPYASSLHPLFDERERMPQRENREEEGAVRQHTCSSTRLMPPARLPCAEAAETLTFSGDSAALSIFAVVASRRRTAKAKPRSPTRDAECSTDVLLRAASRAGRKRRPPPSSAAWRLRLMKLRQAEPWNPLMDV